MLLIFDTETSGLFDYSKPADAPGQPRMCELAALLTTDAGKEIERCEMVIKPDGWSLTPDITAINGLTTELCEQRGVPVLQPLEWIAQRMPRADRICAFNVAFDLKVLRGEFRRAGLDDLYPLGEARKHCIQQAARTVTKLPKNKTPKLSEAVEIILGEKLPGAHGAMVDTIAAARIYHWLAGRQLPADFYAKPAVTEALQKFADERGATIEKGTDGTLIVSESFVDEAPAPADDLI